MGTVFVVNRDQMGGGDVVLGRKILGSCLRKLLNWDDLDAVVFYNGGVKLVADGSPVAIEVGLLHEHGIDLLVCQTCVDHFALGERLLVDGVTNMDEILSTLRGADKVVTL